MRTTIVIILLTVLLGCESAQSRRQQYINAHPNLPAAIKNDIAAGRVCIGMNAEQVKAALGDEPYLVKREVDCKECKATLYYRDWTWLDDAVYKYRVYHFTDNRLTKYQDYGG